MEYAQIGRQVHTDGGEEIIFVSIWRDLEALYGWLGGTDLLRTPMLNDGGVEVLEHFEVQHYEVLESLGGGLQEFHEPLAAQALHAGD